MSEESDYWNAESDYWLAEDYPSWRGIKLGRIFSIKETPDGEVTFTEECDQYFEGKYTKEEAVKILQEAIDWLNQNDPLRKSP